LEHHYKILGIKRSAAPEEVKKAYFEMAKKYHPDSGDETEIRKFHEVADAYKILSDPDSRRAYDLTLKPLDEGVTKIESKPIYESAHTKKREVYRDVELKEFHRNRYKKAVFRVVGFSLLIGLIGYIAAVIIVDVGVFGGVAGLLIGFSLSIHKNFKVESFFTSKKQQRAFRIFTWLLFLCGLGYFVWLVAKDFVLA
jgi:curved DNA-binding protein CbpA